MEHPISIAIETSGPSGGVALGFGDVLHRCETFPAQGRHATQLIRHADDLLRAESLRPTDLEELYVSAGPGSFTGLRIGITVARTLAQAVKGLNCVAVPTAYAVAERNMDMQWQHLAVLFEARDELFHTTIFARRDEQPEAMETPRVAKLSDVLAATPRPLLLVGTRLKPGDIDEKGISVAETERAIPTAEGVWRAGRRLAREGAFVEPLKLLPIYARRPEAERLWEKRHGR
ncbi:MAG: tRNA (adenosine(37)-N6)-threonylcarbamoyltransferase complex dimerization subunit type 1 TsaB [Phycisphaerae bacterium]